MWYCENCKNEFEEPARKEIMFEEYYGVDHLFFNNNKMTLLICPYCKEDDIEEMKKCDYCEEWNRDCDLYDTEGCVNGDCGYLCEQCLKDCDIMV